VKAISNIPDVNVRAYVNIRYTDFITYVRTCLNEEGCKMQDKINIRNELL
jgi:hypothetical protein